MREVAGRLDLACELALGAGDVLGQYWGRLSGYDRKGSVDLVSQADRASEEYLKSSLNRSFPDDAVVAEESGSSVGSTGYTWIIDPLDGTTNFVHGHPMYAVSIALSSPRGMEVGVIYVPPMRELFYCSRGQGAFGPDGPISVSSVATLSGALLTTGFPYNRRDIAPTLMEDVTRMMRAGQGIRRMGAAAVDMAYVACGRYDGFVERGLKAWDTAAGMLLVEEAGGRVTNFGGARHDPFEPEVVATNGLLHDALLNVVFDGRVPYTEGS